MFWKEENVNFKIKNMLYWSILKSISICTTEVRAFLYMFGKMISEVCQVFSSLKKNCNEKIFYIKYIMISTLFTHDFITSSFTKIHSLEKNAFLIMPFSKSWKKKCFFDNAVFEKFLNIELKIA